MKITYKGDYALKAVLDLAKHHGEDPVTINEIAKSIDAPVKFLEQVLLELKKGGFIESRRGKIGGYLLSRPPNKIILGDVVRFVDGPIEPISCVRQKYSGCGDLYKCVFRDIWKDVDVAISNVVDKVTFADLLSKTASDSQGPAYSI